MLTQSVLAQELQNLTPDAQSESVGISRFVNAFAKYFEDATVNGVALTVAALAPAKAAMTAAMAGVSAVGAGPAKIQAGISAFWTAVNTSAAALWVHVPPVTGVTPPPGLSGLTAALTAAGAANVAAKASLVDATAAIAAAIHGTQTGGIAAVGPPSATFPIL